MFTTQWSRVTRKAIALGAVLATLLVASPASAAVFVQETPATQWRVNGRVYAVEIVGDLVFVGGQFTTATSPTGQTAARKNLAAFRFSDGSLVTGWKSDAGAVVRALDSDGSSLYVGGFFSSIGGVTRRALAKVDLATGAVDTGFNAGLNEAVRGIDVDAGSVYVGGHFTVAGGDTHNRVAKVSATTGAVDPAFTASANANVYGIRVNPALPTVYVAGAFTTMNGLGRPGLVGVSSSTGAPTAPVLSGTTAPTLAVDVSDGGSRVFSGAGSNAVTAWRTSNGNRIWRHYGEGDIQAVHYFGDTLYFGFHDGFDDDFTVKLLAADGETGVFDPDFRPIMNQFWGVFGIDATAAGLAVAGDFTQIQGVSVQGWARFLP